MSGGFQAVWFRILCLSGKTSRRPKGEHPFQDIQRSERCRRAVTLVIVRLPLGQAGTLREDRLRPVGCLNLAFLGLPRKQRAVPDGNVSGARNRRHLTRLSD